MQHNLKKEEEVAKTRDSTEPFDLEELEKLKEGLDIQNQEMQQIKDKQNLDIGDDEDITDSDLNIMIVRLRKVIERNKAMLEGEDYKSDDDDQMQDSDDSDEEERKRKEREAQKKQQQEKFEEAVEQEEDRMQ
jgi:hypothetical protein